MKRLLILLFVSLAISGFAQEDELNLKEKDNQTLGYYFSFDTKISKLHGDYVIYSGMRFGFVKNHKYTIGLAGYGLSGKNTFNYADSFEDVFTFRNEVYYGGLLVEYTFLNKSPVHISTPLLLGGGRSTIKENVPLNQYEFDDSQNREDDYWATVEYSSFVVFELGVSVEVVLLKWLRIGLGSSYRQVIGNNLNSLPDADDDLSGFSFDINLKLGSF